MHPVATHLYIPLDGIAVEEAEVRLGSVRLVRMDDEAFERLVIQPFADIMQANPVYDSEAGAEAVETHRRHLQSLRGRTCVEVTPDLDLEGTLAAADSVADDVCDFLQVCVAALVPRQLTNPVRWSNGVVQAWRWAFGVSDRPRPRSNSNAQLAYGGPPIIIGTTALDKLREYGLLGLGDALGRPPATEYAALLRRAVRWFAKGERERHPDDRELAYVTAIDLFFSDPGRGATRRFCEGFAFVMCENPASVARVARTMYGVYASRSETSHGGAVDVESDEDVDRLRWSVLEFLARMAAHGFQRKADVEAWVKARREAMTDAERAVLKDATKWDVVNVDTALTRAIGLIRGDMSLVPFDDAQRGRLVLSRLLIDAAGDGSYLLALRPLAYDLKAALEQARDHGEDPVPVALAALASLPWLEQSFRTRMASDFT